MTKRGLLVLGLLAAPPLAAQDRWEYGRLMFTSAVPMVWTTADTSISVDSALAVFGRVSHMMREATSGRKVITPTGLTPIQLTLQTMNRLGREGWELVAIVDAPALPGEPSSLRSPDVMYLFKRRLLAPSPR